MIKGIVNDRVPLVAQVVGEVAHCSEEADDFLDMVANIIGFLSHFEQGVNRLTIGLLIPGMLLIELVAQDEPEPVELHVEGLELEDELFRELRQPWLQ